METFITNGTNCNLPKDLQSFLKLKKGLCNIANLLVGKSNPQVLENKGFFEKILLNKELQKLYNTVNNSDTIFVYNITPNDVDSRGNLIYPFISGVEILKKYNLINKFLFNISPLCKIKDLEGFEDLNFKRN